MAEHKPDTRSFKQRCELSELRVNYGYPTHHVHWRMQLEALLARTVFFPRRSARAHWIPYRGEGRLLDFGCGAGKFLQQMRALGWTVEGLDISETVAQRVEQATGITVLAGSLPNEHLAAESFDCVTM